MQKQVEKRTRQPDTISYFSWRLLLLLFLLVLVCTLHLLTNQPLAPLNTMNSCRGYLRNLDYTRFLPKTNGQEIAAIEFLDQIPVDTPIAMVQVQQPDAHSSLYLYRCMMSRSTAQQPVVDLVFKLERLLNGQASMSHAGTLVVAQDDPSQFTGGTHLLHTPPASSRVYQEYAWDGATFVPITFTALYPVTNRAEAEFLQDQADTGARLPWSDPLITARLLAKDIFQWETSHLHTALIEQTATKAQVQLLHEQTRTRVTLTLERLIHARGLWFVTEAATKGLLIDTTSLQEATSSPRALHFAVSSKQPTLHITLLDHTFHQIPWLFEPVLAMQDASHYRTTLYYNNPFVPQTALLFIRVLPRSNAENGQLLLSKIQLGN